MERLYILIPTLAMAAAFASACKAGAPEAAPGASSSSPAPSQAVALKNITGAEIKSLIASSRRPAVVNLWATWCEPCRKEMPVFLKFHETSGKKMSLFLISANDPKENQAASDFLRELKVGPDQNYFYRIGEDAEKFGKALAPTWSATLPTTFVFDGKGALKTFWIGETTQKQLEDRLKTAGL